MQTPLARYVAAVREICDGGYSMPAKVERIRTEAAKFAKEVKLTEEQRFIPEGSYGRNLLYRDPDHDFVVIAMIWPPNTGGSPHDHATWGVVAVAEGAVRIDNYLREDDGSNPEVARLVKTSSFDASAGEFGNVLPPHEEIHAVSNPTDALAISIHTYGRDIRRCRIFDGDTGAIEHVSLGYHTGDAPAEEPRPEPSESPST